MASKDDIELMQHADGELDERGAAELRARIERAPDAAAKLDALGELTELVRGHLELTGEAVPDRRFDAMWQTIAGRVGGDAAAPAERGASVWGKVSAWFDRFRGHIITGAVSAGAVAALALVLRPSAGDDGVARTHGGPIEVQPAALRAAPVIEALDTPGGDATVLNLEDEDGHTAVIWVTPADTVEGI